MKNKHLIKSNIESFYTKASEETRLEKGMGAFEFARTKALIASYLTDEPCRVVDVGGGTGKYAAWLAARGHDVHLVEPVPRHLDRARHRARQAKRRFQVHPGEARHLKFPTNWADLVLLHGPLYHLQAEKDRLHALAEAKRVLKVGGIALGFAINHSASTLVGLLNGLLHQPPFWEMCKAELTTGLHNPPDDFPWLLTEAYFHKPGQLQAEFVSQGFAHLNSHAVEGMAWLDQRFFTHLEQAERRETLLELIRITETDPTLLAISPHVMVAAQKQSIHGT